MPAEIVTETCLVPECNLREQDIEELMDELKNYISMFEPAFQRVEQLERSEIYLRGLLGDAVRKNVEQMALGLGENVRDLQYFVGQSPWKAEPVIEVHQRLVGETLGEADGVALIDESGVVKQGDCSVGVAAQYCGAVGKIANSQNGVYLGYASRKIQSDRRTIVHAGKLFDEAHKEQCEACGVPADLKAKRNRKLGWNCCNRAVERDSLPFQWVAADELYGDSPTFRDGVAALKKWYFTEIKCSTLIWQTRPEVYLPEWKGRGRHPIRLHLRNEKDHPIRVADLVPAIPADAWSKATIKEGSKGPIVCGFASWPD